MVWNLTPVLKALCLALLIAAQTVGGSAAAMAVSDMRAAIVEAGGNAIHSEPGIRNGSNVHCPATAPCSGQGCPSHPFALSPPQPEFARLAGRAGSPPINRDATLPPLRRVDSLLRPPNH